MSLSISRISLISYIILSYICYSASQLENSRETESNDKTSINKGPAIKSLTLQDYNRLIDEKKPLVLICYNSLRQDPENCKALETELEDAAEQLQKQSHTDIIYTVDCDNNLELCSQNHVTLFPTMRFYRNGSWLYNLNAKKADEITKKIMSFLSPNIIKIVAPAQLIQQKEALSLVLYSPGESSPYRKTFIELSSYYNDGIVFYELTNPDLIPMDLGIQLNSEHLYSPSKDAADKNQEVATTKSEPSNHENEYSTKTISIEHQKQDDMNNSILTSQNDSKDISIDIENGFKTKNQGSNGITMPDIIFLIDKNHQKHVYNMEPDTAKLRMWTYVNSMPALADLNHESLTTYLNSPFPVVFIIYLYDEQRKTLYEELHDVACRYRYQYSMALVNDHEKICYTRFLGVQDLKNIAIIVIDLVKNCRYKYPNDFISANLVSQFLDNISLNLVPSWKISAPIPDNTTNGIQLVVHDNYNEIIQVTREVMMVFTAQWCQVCTQLEKTLNDIAKAYKKYTSQFLICKYVIENNDVPDKLNITIKEVPDIYILRHNKSPIRYLGDFSMISLLEFLHNNLDPTIQPDISCLLDTFPIHDILESDNIEEEDGVTPIELQYMDL